MPDQNNNFDTLNVLGGQSTTGQAIQLTLEEQVELLMQTFEEVNQFFIAKIAVQIKTIGEMNQSSINRYTIMTQMNKDIAAINAKLARACNVGIKRMYQIFQTALNDTYTDPRFERALTEEPLPDAAKKRLEHYVQSVSRQSAGTMKNLSNTTAVSEQYRRAVDKAVLAVSSGLGDYQSVTRAIVQDIGYGGMQVQYESGHKRRLDTAVRQNVIDGTKQIMQHGSDIMGEELGYDAYEISAHTRSAPDHEPVQGHVFLKEQFERMQSGQDFTDVDGHHFKGFRRPIAEWNCMHFAMSFSTKYSVRKYTDEQLSKFIEDNHKGCKIGNKEYTIYAAGQLMRQIETEVRRLKEAANMARDVGDNDLRLQYQKKIDALAEKYAQISKASGIKMRKERMSVPGFKMVKIKQ